MTRGSLKTVPSYANMALASPRRKPLCRMELSHRCSQRARDGTGTFGVAGRVEQRQANAKNDQTQRGGDRERAVEE